MFARLHHLLFLGMLLALGCLGFISRSHSALAASPSPAPTAPDCVNTLISDTLSPDKLWNAATYQEFCAGGSAIETTIVLYIVVNSAKNPSDKGEVFDIDTQGNSFLNPSVAWQAHHALSITTINAHITLQKNSYSSVPISYIYK